MTDLRTETPLRELTAPPAYTPFGGESRGSHRIGAIRAKIDHFLTDLEKRSRTYAFSLPAIALGVAGALILSGHGLDEVWLVLLLAGTAALAERGSVRLSSTTEQSISLLPTVFAAVLGGPLAAMIVGAASMIGDVRPPYLRVSAYAGSRALTGGVCGLVATRAAELGSGDLGGIVAATLAAAVVAEGLDVAFVMMAMWVRAMDRSRLLRTHLPIIAVSVALYSPVIALLSFVYEQVSPYTLPLFLVPALAAQRLFGLYQAQRDLTTDLVSVNARLEQASLSFASALVATLDARDKYTAGHSASVATYARDIARRMGLSAEDQQLAHLCGLVHDIGKVGLPAGLLEKEGPLTLDERRRMEDHSVIGERILRNVEDYAGIARIVRHHHERVDGNGYPDRLVAEDIPLISRIIAVADAYDAMTSDRPYREAMPSRVARLRLAQAVESQFDTTVVAAFEAILASASEEYRRGRGAEMLEISEVLLKRAVVGS